MNDDSAELKVEFLTREYPPEIYGGAGVHAQELSKVLAERVDVTVRAFDGPRLAVDIPQIPAEDPSGSLRVVGYDVPEDYADDNTALKTFAVDLLMAQDADGADVIHAHTWYTCLAGRLAQQMHDIPLVVTAHSLEPLRPWKRQQIGGGYNLSRWAEEDAFTHADRIIAVSEGMRNDILSTYPQVDPEKVVVIHNGITMSDFATPDPDDSSWDVFDRYSIDRDQPTLLYSGRMSQSKGLFYLLQALEQVDPQIQVVLCGNLPEGYDMEEEIHQAIDSLNAHRQGRVIWIDGLLERDELNALRHGCDAFVCPSLYEPLGVATLEAMASGLPVVAAATGVTPELVVNDKTGYLVPVNDVDDETGMPLDPQQFVADLADAINRMMSNPQFAEAMGIAGYERARDFFSWETIADQTIDIYNEAIAEHHQSE